MPKKTDQQKKKIQLLFIIYSLVYRDLRSIMVAPPLTVRLCWALLHQCHARASQTCDE